MPQQVKNSSAVQETQRHGFIPGSGRSSGGGKWQPSPVFLPEKTHGQRSHVGYSPKGHKELDTTDWLRTKNTQVKVKVAQSCLTLCDPVDCSQPGSSIHGIFQARILEWVAISFSRGSFQPRDRTQTSHIAGRCLNPWATREAHKNTQLWVKSLVF